MGFSNISTEIIFFIIITLISASIAITLASSINEIGNSVSALASSYKNKYLTDFIVANDPMIIPTIVIDTTTYHIFYIKNTGNIKIPLDNTTVLVLVDGRKPENYFFEKYAIKPGEVSELYVCCLLSGEHKLIIYLENGIKKEFEFVI